MVDAWGSTIHLCNAVSGPSPRMACIMIHEFAIHAIIVRGYSGQGNEPSLSGPMPAMRPLVVKGAE